MELHQKLKAAETASAQKVRAHTLPNTRVASSSSSCPKADTEPPSLKVQAVQIIKNLQRENALMATAWYDLTSRLQSNHVVMQRRDPPKSWLNKQRQMVNGQLRRRDSLYLY